MTGIDGFKITPAPSIAPVPTRAPSVITERLSMNASSTMTTGAA